VSHLPNLPNRIHVVNTCLVILTREAIKLLQAKRAREVYADGKFIGIELGHFGPKPTAQLSQLPPTELPGLRFQDPNPQRKYAKFHWSFV